MDELLRLLDDARADERAEARGHERHLVDSARAGARFAGTLLDLAERGAGVAVRTSAGRSHRGALRLVASDFCVVHTDAGDVWLALAAITSVRPGPDAHHPPATGTRAASDLLLVEALARAVDRRPRLALVLDGGELVAGVLEAVGVDVVTVRLDGDSGTVSYVSASSVREVFRSG